MQINFQCLVGGQGKTRVKKKKEVLKKVLSLFYQGLSSGLGLGDVILIRRIGTAPD
jgi:hypothetical protein